MTIFLLTLSDDDYDYFNERLGDELYSILPKEVNENKIISYSDFKLEHKEISEFSNTILDINKNGGIVYKLIFLENVSDLDTTKLDKKWNIDKKELSKYYKPSKNKNPYLVIGHLSPNQVEEISSSNSKQDSHNSEINLKSNPIKYELIPYRDTPDADKKWNKKLL